jgi:hypothetical protein
MKTLQTETLILATREKVWKILTDFNSYPEWNPFIIEISGDLKVGYELTVTRSIEGRKPTTFKPKVLTSVPNKKFCWRGKLLMPGIFDGTHFFTVEDVENGKTRLIHVEIFKGILAGMLLRRLGAATLAGFEKMNQALKEKAEN